MTGQYDVVGVHLKTNKVRLMATRRDEKNADAIVEMAVRRRLVEEEFFAKVPSGAIADGADWADYEGVVS